MRINLINISRVFCCITMVCLLGHTTAVFAQEQQETPKEPPKEQAQEKSEQSTESEQQTPVSNETPRSELKIVAPIAKKEINNSDLNHYLAKDTLNPILVGTEEHLTVFEANKSASNKGVVIFLPNWQENALSPKATNFLRATLPDQGWTTISVQPLTKPNNYPATAENNSERQQQNQQTIDEYSAKLQVLMTQIVEQAKAYPGIILLVAEGQNANHLLPLIQQDKMPPPTVLVMLSGYSLTASAAMAANKALAQLAIPVLDLSLRTDNRQITEQLAARQAAVNKEFKTNYRQQTLFNTYTGYYPEQPLLKAINGWLRTNGW